MAQPSRRKRAAGHARTDILQASARAFARLGFAGTTIQDIAREAGYTAPSLYAYFKGKQGIIDALIATMATEMSHAFEIPVSRGLTFAQRLALLFRRLADVADRWAEARILLFEIDRAGKGTSSRRMFDLTKDNFFRKLSAWFRKNATHPKDLGGKDPEEVAYFVRGLLQGAALLGERDRFRKSAHARIELALHICLHGIGGAPAGKASLP